MRTDDIKLDVPYAVLQSRELLKKGTCDRDIAFLPRAWYLKSIAIIVNGGYLERFEIREFFDRKLKII